MNVHLYLNKPSEPKTLIMIHLNYDGNRVKISTQRTIEKNLWNITKEVVKNSAENSLEINTFLKNLTSKVGNIYYEAKAIGVEPTPKYMKSKIQEFLNPIEPIRIDKKVNFFNHFECFIEARSKSLLYKPRTIKHYVTSKNHLRNYAIHRRKKITFDSFDKHFFEDFIKYLTNEVNEKKKHRLVVNTVGGIVKTLKIFLNYSFENGLINNQEFKKTLKVWKRDSQAIALNKEEVKAIENVELKSSSLDNVRNLFLIMLYTGIRYSDLERLSPENIYSEEKVIKINVTKTETSLIIPISKPLLRILDKYPNYKFKVISNQKFNKAIKEVCQEAKIDSLIQQTKYYGKERVDERIPKYELVSAHTARRSFITIILKDGTLPEMIMQVSGHKDRRAFQKYVKIAQSEGVEAVRDALDIF
jgi:integrase